MIQFNLLPDVKKEYVKAKRLKRMIMSASVLASAGAIGVTILMFMFVHVAQKKNINDLGKDIQKVTSEIKATPNLDTILTVQNQLSLLPQLHESKPETSRLFDYLSFVSPQSVRISTVDLDTKVSTMAVSGGADSIATVNKFVDNIKALEYSVAGTSDSLKTFANVVTQVSGSNESAEFRVTMSYDPAMYVNTHDVTLKLGNETMSTAPNPTPQGGQQ